MTKEIRMTKFKALGSALRFRNSGLDIDSLDIRHSSFPNKLRMQLRVMPSLREQFIMRSSLNDLSLRQHENAVRISDCGKPMCHDKTGAASEQLLQRMLDCP